MQTLSLSVFSAFAVVIIASSLLYSSSKRRRKNLPPQPAPPLPLIGHLHLLKHPIHRTFQAFSKTIGPIFSLRFGSRHVIVVSSPSLAEECFTKNDIVFANRPRLIAGKHIGYNDTSMVGSPYGDHWRNLRRIAAEEIFSAGRLKVFHSIRQDEVKQLVRSLYGVSQRQGGGVAKVELQSRLSELTFNVIMRMVAGKRYFGDGEGKEANAEKFREMIKELFEQAEATNPEDFLPFLRWVDYRGLEKSLAKLAKEMDSFFQGLIDEHRREKKNTMIGHLLNLQESNPEYYVDQIIKGLIMVMITAGTDTSSATIEWAMSLLLNHPHVMKKARDELDVHVGFDRLVDEADLSNLTYLQCIISETFRTFPAAPLLIVHEASQDCTLREYDVPRGTLLFINAWAIHRDPGIWGDAETFRPERFIGREVDPYTLMPFGRGRRSCPGYGLAQRVVGLGLATLIHSFEWEKVDDKAINLDEGKGLSMPKAIPLEALCKPREVLHKVFTESF